MMKPIEGGGGGWTRDRIQRKPSVVGYIRYRTPMRGDQEKDDSPEV